jgi:hypothetical protein
MDLEAVRDDDHVVALYRERGLWGGIAKSNYAGLRFRAPVYRTLRELALSYFESTTTICAESGHCGGTRWRWTWRGWMRKGWMTSEEDVWCVPELLIAARHYRFVSGGGGKGVAEVG